MRDKCTLLLVLYINATCSKVRYLYLATMTNTETQPSGMVGQQAEECHVISAIGKGAVLNTVSLTRSQMGDGCLDGGRWEGKMHYLGAWYV